MFAHFGPAMDLDAGLGHERYPGRSRTRLWFRNIKPETLDFLRILRGIETVLRETAIRCGRRAKGTTHRLVRKNHFRVSSIACHVRRQKRGRWWVSRKGPVRWWRWRRRWRRPWWLPKLPALRRHFIEPEVRQLWRCDHGITVSPPNERRRYAGEAGVL